MKVLILSHMFPNELDGSAGIFVLEQARALRAAGVQLQIVSPTPWAPRLLKVLPSVRKYAVIPVRSMVDRFTVGHPCVPTLPKNIGFSWSGAMFYLSCRRLVAKILREHGIDVIHAHTVLPDGFAAVLLGREFGVPVVCTAHGSDINVYPKRNRLVHWASQWALRYADRVVMVSENLRSEALALAGSREITVVHNGADAHSFKIREKSEARSKLGLTIPGKLVSFIGYLRAEKGLEYLLQAFAQLHQPDVRLCIVGDGLLRASLIAKAQQLGIAEQCLFVGQRPHDEIPLWIAAANCLVLASLSEGLPTILPEAMLCGVPVVATPVGGIPEVIRHRETGLLVPCKDSGALAIALQQLLSDERLALELAGRAQAFAQRSLTWAKNAEAMIDIYEDAVREFAVRSAGKSQRRKFQSASVH